MHQRWCRYVRSADPVAVRDGREPLHRRAEQAGECLGLGFAELRVLGGDVSHRAVMLAKLLSPAGRRGMARGRRVAVAGQRGRERLHPVGRGGRLDGWPVPAL